MDEIPITQFPPDDALRCPKCFRKDIVPSLRSGFIDDLMRRWGRIPRQCRFCAKRFYVKEEEVAGKSE